MRRSAHGEIWCELKRCDVFGLGTFLALAHFESDLLAILKRNATGGCLVYLTEVDKYVTLSVVGLDKSVAFFVVEPFYGSILQFCHRGVPFMKIW